MPRLWRFDPISGSVPSSVCIIVLAPTLPDVAFFNVNAPTLLLGQPFLAPEMQVATGDLAAIAALVGKQPDALLRFDSDDAHCACALSIGDSPPCTIGRISPHEAIFTAVLPKAGGAAFDDDYWRLDFSIEHIEESFLKLIHAACRAVPAHKPYARIIDVVWNAETPKLVSVAQAPPECPDIDLHSFTALFRITSATETVSTFAFFSDVGPIAIGPTALSGG